MTNFGILMPKNLYFWFISSIDDIYYYYNFKLFAELRGQGFASCKYVIFYLVHVCKFSHVNVDCNFYFYNILDA